MSSPCGSSLNRTYTTPFAFYFRWLGEGEMWHFISVTLANGPYLSFIILYDCRGPVFCFLLCISSKDRRGKMKLFRCMTDIVHWVDDG